MSENADTNVQDQTWAKPTMKYIFKKMLKSETKNKAICFGEKQEGRFGLGLINLSAD